MKLTESLPSFSDKYIVVPLLCALMLWLFGYSTVVSLLNPAPPEEARLQTWRIQVLRASTLAPQLTVKLADGSERKLYFPSDLYGVNVLRGKVWWLDKSELAALAGCDGVAAVAPVKGLWPERMVFWRFECGKVRLSYTQLSKEYIDREARFRFPWALTVSVMCGLWLVGVLRITGRLTQEMIDRVNPKLW